MPNYNSTPVDTARATLSEGVHRARVVDWDEKMGGSGFPYWAFTLEIQEGQPWDGTRLYTNISHSPKARFKMDEWLDAFRQAEGTQVYAEQFVGKYLRVNVQMGEYDGRKRPEVANYLPDGTAQNTKHKQVERASTNPVADQTTTAEEPVVETTNPNLAGLSATEVTTTKGLPEDVVTERKRPF